VLQLQKLINHKKKVRMAMSSIMPVDEFEEVGKSVLGPGRGRRLQDHP